MARKMTTRTVVGAVLLVVLYFVGRLAGETLPTDESVPQCKGSNCFELFNACRPIHLVVASLGEDAAEIGLTKKRIQTAAESRLRAARLYDPSSGYVLYVNVNVVGHAYNINVEHHKWLHDVEFNLRGIAETWSIGSTGTHAGDAGYILQFVSEHVDRFVVEYLRVNEAACGGP